MADYPLTPCLCGADTLTLGPSTHRVQAREAAEQHLQDLAAIPNPTAENQSDYAHTQLALQVLQPEHQEVSCGTCGRWVHDETEAQAANLWNRAIAKLDALQPCCEQDYDARRDYDGMAIYRCTSEAHDTTINGPRYLPLEASETFEVKPSDAGGRPA